MIASVIASRASFTSCHGSYTAKAVYMTLWP